MLSLAASKHRVESMPSDASIIPISFFNSTNFVSADNPLCRNCSSSTLSASAACNQRGLTRAREESPPAQKCVLSGLATDSDAGDGAECLGLWCRPAGRGPRIASRPAGRPTPSQRPPPSRDSGWRDGCRPVLVLVRRVKWSGTERPILRSLNSVRP